MSSRSMYSSDLTMPAYSKIIVDETSGLNAGHVERVIEMPFERFDRLVQHFQRKVADLTKSRVCKVPEWTG